MFILTAGKNTVTIGAQTLLALILAASNIAYAGTPTTLSASASDDKLYCTWGSGLFVCAGKQVGTPCGGISTGSNGTKPLVCTRDPYSSEKKSMGYRYVDCSCTAEIGATVPRSQ